MKPLKHLLLLVCLLAISEPLFAVAKPYQQEKVYLHFDNTAYFIGETIWFKAYVVQTGRNALSPLSKTLYVELVSPAGVILESKKLKLVDGKADGFFALTTTRGGYYEIRAYTRFVLNQGDDAMFSRVFACYDKPELTGDYQNRTMTLLPTSNDKTDDMRIKSEDEGEFNLRFYPEGGKMVEGLTSLVAFKAIDKDGEQAAVSGAVLSDRGDTLAILQTSHQGMGAFLLTPPLLRTDARKKPLTAWVYSGNKKYKIPLPEALPSGYVLFVDNSDQEQVSIMVKRSAGLPNERLGIDISCRGIIYGEDTLSFTRGDAFSLHFPTRLLPSGVTQITLHSMDGRPLAERLILVNHHSEMHIEATPDRPSYRPYEPINIDFSLTDSKRNPVETDFSLSVKDSTTSPYDAYADNMLTNLLLSSELKGHIAAPGYYFVDDSPERRNDLDLLMLTQGWTRYDWKRVAGIDTTQFYHPYEESLLIEGNVYSLWKDKVKEGVEVNMILIGDSTSQRGTCMTDSTGRFNLKVEDCYGTSELVVETKIENEKKETNERKEHTIRLDRVFSPSFKAYEASETREPFWPDSPLNDDAMANETDAKQAPIWTDSVWITVGKRDPESDMLPEVQINAKRVFNKQTWISKIQKKASIVIDAEKAFNALVDTSDWVPAEVPQFLASLLPLDNDGNYKGKKTATIYYNERGEERISDLVHLEKHVRDIKMITVKEGIDIWEPDYPDAEAFIYIYYEPEYQDPIGIRKVKYDGYSLTKTFYSPPYDKLHLPDPDDVRRTLYWNPSVQTDANGKASVSFYNNRSARNLSISAETVTGSGMIGVLNQ